MKEFIQSVYKTSNERIKNPFIGSYLIAFFIYNWRPFFLLLFSESKIEDKIMVINYFYCSKSAIFWPLCIALFYILILPYVNLIFDYALSYSNDKKNISTLNNLKQKKSEATHEREIAEERAGTMEFKNLQDKIEILENENEIKSIKINEISLAANASVESLEKESKQHKTTITELKQQLQTEKDQNIEIKEIFSLLINPKQTSIRDIKNYLRTNLNNNDFLELKERAENRNINYFGLPLDYASNALLLKAKVFYYDELVEAFKITDEGVKFVEDLE